MTLGRGLTLSTLVFFAGACRKPATPPPMMDSATVAAAHAGEPGLDPDVRLAAGFALAVKAHPEMRDSMLSAYRVTAAQLDSIKARIAADTAKQAAYDRLVATGTTPRDHR